MVENPLREEQRPWYREPWPWVLIAIPLLAVIAGTVTFWLAVAHPDYLVVGEPEYRQISTQLRAQSSTAAAPATEHTDGDR